MSTPSPAPSAAPKRLLHAIRAWDATEAGERPLCGTLETVYGVEKTIWHVYVSCPACRTSAGFGGDPNDPPWALPETVAESTENLRRMRTSASSQSAVR